MADASSNSESSKSTDDREIGRGRRSRGRGRGSSAGRGRGRAGSRSRSGGARGGRGRGSRQSVVRSDEVRVRERRQERIREIEGIVQAMDENRLRGLVVRLVQREPGLFFDLVDDGWAPPPVPPAASASLAWCRCTYCVDMPTELERKCCGCTPQNCISQRDVFQRICLDEEVLAVAQAYFNDMMGRHGQQMEDHNNIMRHAAYRSFILWRHGRLGAGTRRVIPSCCVRKIRQTFPSQTGVYTGFLPGRFV